MVTKNDMTKFGSYCIMGLFGLIIASVVNIFVASSTLDWIISLFGVALLDVYKRQAIYSAGRTFGALCSRMGLFALATHLPRRSGREKGTAPLLPAIHPRNRRHACQIHRLLLEMCIRDRM